MESTIHHMPNWLTALKQLFETITNISGRVTGRRSKSGRPGRTYFKKMYDYLEDFHGNLQEIKAGRKSRDDVAKHMLGGPMLHWEKRVWSNATSISF